MGGSEAWAAQQERRRRERRAECRQVNEEDHVVQLSSADEEEELQPPHPRPLPARRGRHPLQKDSSRGRGSRGGGGRGSRGGSRGLLAAGVAAGPRGSLANLLVPQGGMDRERRW